MKKNLNFCCRLIFRQVIKSKNLPRTRQSKVNDEWCKDATKIKMKLPQIFHLTSLSQNMI